MKITLVLLLISISLSACKQKGDDIEIIEINPKHFISKELKLSDIAGEVIYIPLDSTKIFGRISHCEFTDDFIFISTGKEILKFDHSGKLLQQIGSLGPGPEEYTRCLMFTIDAVTHRIFVSCSPEIVAYSFDGDFLYRFQLPQEVDPIYVRYRQESLYCFPLVHTTIYQSPYLWVKVNSENGELQEAKSNIGIRFYSDEMSVRGNYTCPSDNGTLLYWNHFNDTIFRLGDKGYTTAYVFGEGNFRLTPDRMTEHTDDKCMIVRTIVDTKKYLFMEYRMNKHSHLCMYNKEEATFTDHAEQAIKNDIDGGIPCRLSTYQAFNGKEYLLQIASPEDLIVTFQQSDNKTLKEWSRALKENDNQVIILYELK